MQKELKVLLTNFKEIWHNLTTTIEPPSTEPPYELMIIHKTSRKIYSKRFHVLKEAVAYVSPDIFFDHENDYIVLNRFFNNSFIKLNKSTLNGKNERAVYATS
jgi:hypothetical protein